MGETSEFVKALIRAKQQKSALYSEIITNLPSMTMSFASLVEKGSRSDRESLNLFFREVAPDLTTENLLLVLGQTDSWQEFEGIFLRILQERTGYPAIPSVKKLSSWVPDQTQGTLESLSVTQRYSDIFNRHIITSLRAETKVELADLGCLCTLPTGNAVPDFLEEFRNQLDRIRINTTNADPATWARSWRAISNSGWLLKQQDEALLSRALEVLERLPANGTIGAECYESLLKGSRIFNPELRERVIDGYVIRLSAQLGLDDQTDGFCQRVDALLDRLLKEVPMIDLKTIGDRLAEKIESQRKVSYLIEEKTSCTTSDISQLLWFGGATAEVGIGLLRRREDYRNGMLAFLLSDGEENSARIVAELFDGYFREIKFSPSSWVDDLSDDDYTNKIKHQFLLQFQTTYREFWRLPLEGRAIFAKELLPSDAKASVDATFNFVVDRILPEDMRYYEQARLRLKQYVHALPSFSQHIALSALLTAGDPAQKGDTTPGKIIATFAESQGPAEVKFVQALMDAPGLPTDLREDLIQNAGHLKFRVQVPSRANIYRIIDLIEERDGIKFGKLGPIKGCGSMNVVIKLKGGDELLCLRRPNCEQRAKDGFDVLLRMIEQMPSSDPLKEWLKPIITQAKNRATLEGNFRIAGLQYDKGGENYREWQGTVDGYTFKLDAAKVQIVGEEYYTMSEMKGEHFLELMKREGHSPKVRALAKLILVREFNNILRGKFDCDRHGGQIAITEDTIGHFDFKALSLEEWGMEGHRQIIGLVTALAFNIQTTKEIPIKVLGYVSGLTEEENEVDPMLEEAQKAILSLGDYFAALGESSQQEMAEILFAALTIEMPEPLIELYSEELEKSVSEKLPAEFAQFKPFIKGIIRGVLEGQELPETVTALLPREIGGFIGSTRGGIKFEKVMASSQ